jgi:hypothetical protein
MMHYHAHPAVIREIPALPQRSTQADRPPTNAHPADFAGRRHTARQEHRAAQSFAAAMCDDNASWMGTVASI